MKRKFVGAIALFAAVTAVTLWQTLKTLEPHYYRAELENLVQGRTPAAIRRNLDFSQLDGAELITASQKRLVSAARVILQDSEVGVELGHFVTRDAQGKRQLACDFYTQVTLTFEADGIADNGEKPLMEVEGPCRTGDDITRIEPIWVPTEKILEEKPVNMDLSFDEGVHFKFENMSGEWPTRWVLRSVRLYNESESSREVSLSHSELREILAKPLVLNWSRQ